MSTPNNPYIYRYRGPMLSNHALEVATQSVREDCPEFNEDECQHVAYRVVEALFIAGFPLGKQQALADAMLKERSEETGE